MRFPFLVVLFSNLLTHKYIQMFTGAVLLKMGSLGERRQTCDMRVILGQWETKGQCKVPHTFPAFCFSFSQVLCCVFFLFFLHMCVRVIVQSSTMMVSQKQTEGSCLCEVNSTAGVLATFTARGTGKERNKKNKLRILNFALCHFFSR